jgi:hypothetical protein
MPPTDRLAESLGKVVEDRLVLQVHRTFVTVRGRQTHCRQGNPDDGGASFSEVRQRLRRDTPHPVGEIGPIMPTLEQAQHDNTLDSEFDEG